MPLCQHDWCPRTKSSQTHRWNFSQSSLNIDLVKKKHTQKNRSFYKPTCVFLPLWVSFIVAVTQISAHHGRFSRESFSSWPRPPWSGPRCNWGASRSCCGRCSCPLPRFPPDEPQTGCLSVFPSLHCSSKISRDPQRSLQQHPPPPPPPWWRWGSSAGVGPWSRPPAPPRLAGGPTSMKSCGVCYFFPLGASNFLKPDIPCGSKVQVSVGFWSLPLRNVQAMVKINNWQTQNTGGGDVSTHISCINK